MLKKLVPKSEFSKNILTILTGSSIAQLIPLLVSPLLTRIYSPEDFGIFALYLSVLMIISSVATGRYEMAIMLAKDDEEVAAIVRVIILIMFSFSTVVLLIVFLCSHTISIQLGNEKLESWLYFMPLSIISVGTYQTLNYLLIRYKYFKTVSTNKVFATTTNSSFQVYIGFVFETAFGFLIGRLFANAIAIILIIKEQTIRNILFKRGSLNLSEVLIKHKNFPLYDVPSTLVNTCSSQIPLIIISKYFSLQMLGIYSLMNKVVLMPIAIISKSVQDVFKQKASEEYNNSGNCLLLYKLTLKKLVLLGILPFSTLAMFGPELFSFVFGEKWRVAGTFSQILAPLMFLKFIVSPLSYTFYIAQKQKIDLIGQVFIFVLTIGSMVIGVYYNSIYVALSYYCIFVSLMYTIYLGLSYQYSKGTLHA